jgi:hypothetical protein
VKDALVCAAGITVHGPPDSVLYSPASAPSSGSPGRFWADPAREYGTGARKGRKVQPDPAYSSDPLIADALQQGYNNQRHAEEDQSDR